MAIEQGTKRGWTKSSYSGGNGACLEVRCPGRELLSVRDSKAPAGPRLGFAAPSWAAFVAFMDRDARGGA
jgi:hypothetical protein